MNKKLISLSIEISQKLTPTRVAPLSDFIKQNRIFPEFNNLKEGLKQIFIDVDAQYLVFKDGLTAEDITKTFSKLIDQAENKGHAEKLLAIVLGSVRKWTFDSKFWPYTVTAKESIVIETGSQFSIKVGNKEVNSFAIGNSHFAIIPPLENPGKYDMHFFWTNENRRHEGPFSVDVKPSLLAAGFNTKLTEPNESAEALDRFRVTGQLGSIYNPKQTDVRFWNPLAEKVELIIFKEPNKDNQPVNPITSSMTRSVNGVWSLALPGDKEGLFYQLKVTQNGKTSTILDPYSKADFNRQYSRVVNLAKTDPKDWDQDKSPAIRDRIIYEMHTREHTINLPGTEHPGQFLGILDLIPHLKKLGITTIQLHPPTQFGPDGIGNGKITEGNEMSKDKSGWGYNVAGWFGLEGSFSSNPMDPHARILELKTVIKALHDAGIKVSIDMVWNHTFKEEGILLNTVNTANGGSYYHLTDENGCALDGSGCGNQVAAHRAMVRKLILDTALYFKQELHIDEFRLDLMGLLDITTINELNEKLKEIDPNFQVYGEGWDMGFQPKEIKANDLNMHRMRGIGTFDAEARTGLLGKVDDLNDMGYVSGNTSDERIAATKQAILGGDLDLLNSIIYADCHDNYTISDKIRMARPWLSDEDVASLVKLAYTIVLLSQGTPLIYGGSEVLRSKTITRDNDNKNDRNTYMTVTDALHRAPLYTKQIIPPDGSGLEGKTITVIRDSYAEGDEVNSIKWDSKQNITDYISAITKLRLDHPAFRMHDKQLILNNLKFMDNTPQGVIGFTLNGKASGDSWDKIIVFYNPHGEEKTVEVPHGNWEIVIDNGTPVKAQISGNRVTVPARGALVMHNN